MSKTHQHWTQDADFAGVREPAALAKLTDAERKAWKDVERLRAKAR